MASTISVDKIKSTAGGADTFTLPTADGQAGQSLQTNGSLVLSFGDVDPNSGKGSNIASADPLVIAAGSNYFIVTGTTGFNDMTVAADTHFFLEFAGALIMTHVGGALDLPSGAAITTVAGDVGEFFATAANVVTCVSYTRADGTPIVIADDAITYAKIQNVAADERILGRVSGADGVIEELTKAQVLTFANVEDGADVTDATNVTAAGALMDSECAGLAAVKATTGTFLTADQTKLDAIEASATADQSAGEILTAIENGVDSVHYVDGSIDGVHLAVGKDGALSLDGAPADHSATGPQTTTFAAGYTTTLMDLVYLSSAGRWEEADGDVTTAAAINLLGVALEVKDDGEAMNVALPGSFIQDASLWNFTPGQPVYMGTTDGEITHTKPSGSGDTVRTVGFAVHADMIYFNPSSDYVTLA